MKNHLVTGFFSLCLGFGFTQTAGWLPFTGVRYTQNGISFKEISVELDEHTLTSNRIPMGASLELKLEKPSGFLTENDLCYPGVEVLVLKSGGDTLGYSANIFGNNDEGMDYSMLSNLSLTLSFSEQVKPNDFITIFTSFFDTKSKAQTKLIFPIQIVAADAKPDISFSTYGATSYKGFSAKSTGIELGEIESHVDSSLYPKKLTYSLRLVDLIGITPAEFKTGTFTSWVMDDQLEIREYSDSCTTIAVTSQNDASKTNYLVKFPYEIMFEALDGKSVGIPKKHYFYRFRWESSDHSKVVELVQEIIK